MSVDEHCISQSLEYITLEDEHSLPYEALQLLKHLSLVQRSLHAASVSPELQTVSRVSD